jgi:hypothetical protein
MPAWPRSYLSTATKQGGSKLGALRDLFHGHTWFPLDGRKPVSKAEEDGPLLYELPARESI